MKVLNGQWRTFNFEPDARVHASGNLFVLRPECSGFALCCELSALLTSTWSDIVREGRCVPLGMRVSEFHLQLQ